MHPGAAVVLLALPMLALGGCIDGPEGAPAPLQRIDGAVVDQFLQPYGNTTVHLEPLGRTDVTSRLGGFSFADVPPGRYELWTTPTGTPGTRQGLDVAAGRDGRIILQVIRPWVPGPYMAELGKSADAHLLLPGQWCRDCSWTARLHDQPAEVDLHASWRSAGDAMLEFVVRDGDGRLVTRQHGTGGQLWMPIPPDLFPPGTRQISVDIRCATAAPCTALEVQSHLQVYYGADRAAQT